MDLNEQSLTGLAALLTSISSLIWTLRRGRIEDDRPPSWCAGRRSYRRACGSACKRDPVSGLIGVQ